MCSVASPKENEVPFTTIMRKFFFAQSEQESSKVQRNGCFDKLHQNNPTRKELAIPERLVCKIIDEFLT